MNKSIKTKQNTTYIIDKYTDNIKEITTCNGYVTTNIVHFTAWNEDSEAIKKEFESRLK